MSALLILVAPAFAHEGSDEISVWYRSLTNPQGQSCCSIADCRPVEARLAGDHWEIAIKGGWEAVPNDRVLRRENMDGRPVACIWGGEIRCFIPPAST